MNTLATKDEFANFSRLAAEEGGGRILKFTKDGHWITGQDEINLDGATMLADMAGLAVGWRKWGNGEIVDAAIGYVSTGFKPKDRGDLDDFEEAAWTINSHGEKKDPWQFGYFLKLSDENGQGYTWAAGSNGAKRTIGDLCSVYARKKLNPIVILGAGFYKHRTFGRINTPKLDVAGWSNDALALPAREPFEPIDDEIPF